MAHGLLVRFQRPHCRPFSRQRFQSEESRHESPFAGLTTNFVGIYQVNVAIPANAPAGNAVSLVLTIGGIASNTVTIALQGNAQTASPDLSVALVATPDPVASGSAVTYTASIQNVGTASATECQTY